MKSPWEQAMDAMREDEQIKAGGSEPLWAKEIRADKEQGKYIEDMNSGGVAFLPQPKPDLFA
jgi:hypothetical protein